RRRQRAAGSGSRGATRAEPMNSAPCTGAVYSTSSGRLGLTRSGVADHQHIVVIDIFDSKRRVVGHRHGACVGTYRGEERAPGGRTAGFGFNLGELAIWLLAPVLRLCSSYSLLPPVTPTRQDRCLRSRFSPPAWCWSTASARWFRCSSLSWSRSRRAGAKSG